MGPIITLSGVSYSYGEVWALRGIDLDVQEGQFFGILGPNGSGKTTLLKIMDGILTPREGEVAIKGVPIGSFKRASLATEVAMVSQETHFRFSFSSIEVVLMGRFPHLGRFQFEGEVDMGVALAALEATDCLELAERSIHELSGGEKQRVLIARALAQEPSIILLDEPTSFLDLKYKREIFELLSSLAREKGLSILAISHDIDLAAHYCDRLVMLNRGRIYSMGPAEDVITPQGIETVYGCPVLIDRNPATGSPRVNLR